MSVALKILSNAARLGVTIRVDGENLKLKPARLVSAELVQNVKAHKGALLATLKQSTMDTPSDLETPQAARTAMYGEAERRIFDDAKIKPETMPLCGKLKAAFPDARLLSVRRVIESVRVQAARIIREARGRDPAQAVALRGAWRERLAICMIDGGLSKPKAEKIALFELV